MNKYNIEVIPVSNKIDSYFKHGDNSTKHCSESIESNSLDNNSDEENKLTKIFICPISECRKKYSSKSRLVIHSRTHTGEKPYSCAVCYKSFNEKGNLKIHMRIHTGEKPYQCNFEGCLKSFKAYGHLSDHLKRHYNIKPFTCEICNSSFSRRNTLKTHYLIHSGERPHQCTYEGCNKRFSEKGNMKTHLKTHYKSKLNIEEHDSVLVNAVYNVNHNNLTIENKIEYSYNAKKLISNKRKISDNSGCHTPKGNTSFQINFSGLLDELRVKSTEEIWNNEYDYTCTWMKN